jgi:hypothetical protein
MRSHGPLKAVDSPFASVSGCSENALTPHRREPELVDEGEDLPPESERRPSERLRVIARLKESAQVTEVERHFLDVVAALEADADFPEDEAESQVYFTRDQKRSRRKRAVRPKTINTSRFPKSALEVGRLLQPELQVQRPKTRQDCAEVPRSCPFVSCRYHLYLDVSPRTGSIKLNFPDLEVWEMKRPCALDVAEEGPLGAEELGDVMNLTRERIRQVQERGLAVLSESLECGKFDAPK